MNNYQLTVQNLHWWQRGVIYEIYVRSFKDTTGNGIGDLQGIIDKLDYLNNGTSASLGIDAIWLTPFYPSPMADFGYDVEDYCNVDPLFGNLTTFDRLVTEAHRRGIKIIIDHVPNHTSDKHPWFVESRSSRHNAKRNWYIWRDPKSDSGEIGSSRLPNNWGSYFGGPAWTFDEVTGQYYLHHFTKEQPELNWRNPEVRKVMMDVIHFWLDRGVDGITRNSILDDKQPEYIQIMNIADDCPWREHIVDQYQQVIEKLDFEGIHIDQYGFPKTYYSLVNNKRELKDMAAEFGRFIEYTRKELGEETALIFNAVNNWPVEVVASKPQDVVYIEAWSPSDTFYHLRQLILEAKKLANYKKQIILAAYISSLNKKKKISQEAGERAARLTAATIFANGGFHLVLGEGANILTDAYYPEFCQLTPEFSRITRNYYDLITRYSKYLFSQNLRDKSAFLTGGINDEIKVSVNGEKMNFGPNGEKDSIWTIVKENKKFKTLNLVNLMGIDTIKWDQPQYTDPTIQQRIEIEWLIDEDVKGIYWITADKGDIRPRKIDFIRDKHNRGEIIRFTIPELNYWGLVIVKVY